MPKEPKPKKPYRVFVTRSYICCTWFDVVTTSPNRAKQKALSAARKLMPDPREKAVDNGWIPDEPDEIERIGQSGPEESRRHNPIKQVTPGVFMSADTCK